MRRNRTNCNTPEDIQFVPDLPKTRSGKIIRRLLKKNRNSRT